MHIKTIDIPLGGTPVALILGTGDIASAIGRMLFMANWGVVMLRDEAVPVLRRGMSFDPALEDGETVLDSVRAIRATNPMTLPTIAAQRDGVIVARLDTAVVTAAFGGDTSLLVDARMRKYAVPSDLRLLAACTIGVGPGFVASETVDVAVETLPGQEGGLIFRGPTATPTGQSVPLGGAKNERFACATWAGPWVPMAGLGEWMEAGQTVGLLAGRPVVAPIEGCVRGVVRAMPGGVARGTKLLELDPRPGAPTTGVPPRARAIADGVRRVIEAAWPRDSVAAVGSM